MKLISMVDFVFETGNLDEPTYRDNLANIYSYAMFLKQPLELWMFVPCDENENILDKPNVYNHEHGFNSFVFRMYESKYQQAKERCLFEGFECQKQGGEYLVKFGNEPVWVNWNNSKTIENLARLKPQLTQTAIKQLEL